jgi:hypothetical protein
MEEKPKRQTLWEKKNNFPAEVFRPYTVETDLAAVKENCAICQSEPCCPEHCCDVSDPGFKLTLFLSGTPALVMIVITAGQRQP